MGRYESQRAIAARTISERRQGRKRHGGWLGWFIGRVAALSLTIAAFFGLAALWAAPAPPQAPVAVTAPAPAPAKFGKAPFLSKLAQLAPPSVRSPARAQHPPTSRQGARLPSTDPGYQVLTPEELAAISQAH